MTTSIGVAQAEIYKCPGSVEGKFTYQERPCKGAKVDEHTLKTIPIDKQRIAEAQAKLARELNPEGSQKTEETPRETDAVPAPKTTSSEPNGEVSPQAPVTEKPSVNPLPSSNTPKTTVVNPVAVAPKSSVIPPVVIPKATPETALKPITAQPVIPKVVATPVSQIPKKK